MKASGAVNHRDLVCHTYFQTGGRTKQLESAMGKRRKYYRCVCGGRGVFFFFSSGLIKHIFRKCYVFTGYTRFLGSKKGFLEVLLSEQVEFIGKDVADGKPEGPGKGA